jgi:hypothetical protein
MVLVHFRECKKSFIRNISTVQTGSRAFYKVLYSTYVFIHRNRDQYPPPSPSLTPSCQCNKHISHKLTTITYTQGLRNQMHVTRGHFTENP